MPDPRFSVHPYSRSDFPDGRPEVVIRDGDCEVVLVFDDLPDGQLVELYVVTAETEALEPRQLRAIIPNIDLYVAGARAAMKWDLKDLRGAVDALRVVGRPGRGLPDPFYEGIGREYEAIVDGGEPHPGKTLAERHHVTKSAASRWISEARRRGYIAG